MTRTDKVAARRTSPGSYNIVVNGIVRGNLHNAECGWVFNGQNTDGSDSGAAFVADTKRDAMSALRNNSDWS